MGSHLVPKCPPGWLLLSDLRIYLSLTEGGLVSERDSSKGTVNVDIFTLYIFSHNSRI